MSENKNENKFPLWQLTTPRGIANLARYMWDNFGTELEIITQARNEDGKIEAPVVIDENEDIDKTMRQKPNAVRGQYG